MTEKTHGVVRLKWTIARTDPFNYKPFSPELEPEETYVIVKVPLEYFWNYDEKPEKNNLTPEGLGYVLNQIATGIYNQNKEKQFDKNEMKPLVEFDTEELNDLEWDE